MFSLAASSRQGDYTVMHRNSRTMGSRTPFYGAELLKALLKISVVPDDRMHPGVLFLSGIVYGMKELLRGALAALYESSL